MRLALLAPRNSIHTVRWANEMSHRGFEVHLISAHQGGDALDPLVEVHTLPCPAPLGYFLNAASLRNLLRGLRPEVLHAHFASGYGTLARLSAYHPYVLSVWGSDVYRFPYASPLHRLIIRGNLRAADWLCSTSHVMAAHTAELCPQAGNLSVVPFGVDVDVFHPSAKRRDGTSITVGTVKTLAERYGIDILIRAFAEARRALTHSRPALATRLRLLIVGGGPDRVALENLAREEGVAEVVEFAGQVPHKAVPGLLQQLDVYVAASRSESESFGVAVVEASACGVPVVVSNVGGLPEVVRDGVTGLVVEREDVSSTATAIRRLVEDAALRRRLGRAGRSHVLKRYAWAESAERMCEVYAQVSTAVRQALHGESTE